MGLVIAILSVASAVAFAGTGDVVVRLNGGDNVAYVGETNTVEVWIKNDAELSKVCLGFHCRVGRDFDIPWDGYHNAFWYFPEEVATTYDGEIMMLSSCCGGSENNYIDLGFGLDATSPNLGENSAYVLIGWFELEIYPGQEELPYGVELDNIAMDWANPQPGWLFRDSQGDYPPTFHGVPSTSTSEPSAPARLFHIVHREREQCCVGKVGDVNANGVEEPTIGDVTMLIDHLFVTQTGLFCAEEADINGSGGDITIGDVSALIDHLFLNRQPLPDCP